MPSSIPTSTTMPISTPATSVDFNSIVSTATVPATTAMHLPVLDLNPVVNGTPQWPNGGPHKTIFAVLIAVIFGPLRIFIIVLSLIYMSLASRLLLIGHTRGENLTPLRRLLVVLLVRPVFRIILFFFGFIYVNESGKPTSKSLVPILIANHIGGPWEAAYLMWRANASIVAEVSKVKHWAIRPIFDALEGIPVDRAAIPGGSAGDAVRAAILAAARESTTPIVLIFPEGTCSNGTALLAFKTGAFTPRLPIQSAAVSYSGRKSLDISWVSVGPGPAVIILRLLSSLYIPMKVRWLPPRHPRAEELGADHGLAFMRSIRAELAAALSVPLTSLSLDDVQCGMIASRAHMPPTLAMVELASVNQLVNINLSEAKVLIGAFIAARPDAHGQIDYEHFISLLAHLREGGGGGKAATGAAAMPAAPPLVLAARAEERRLERDSGGGGDTPEARAALDLRRLFNAFDLDGDGVLDAREFIVGLALLSDRVPAPGVDSPTLAQAHAAHLHVAFQLLCDEGIASVSQERFARVLHHVWPTLSDERVAEVFAQAAEGGGRITEDHFRTWVVRADVAEQLPLFRERFVGVDLISLAVAAEKVKRTAP